jgi:rhodanese-related sulfurtransferase
MPGPQVTEQASGDLDPLAFKAEIDRGGARLIDVRTPREYAAGHIPGSENIDWTSPDFEAAFARLDPATPVLLYCLVGGRSEQAKEYLAGKGFRVKHLAEGYSAWKKAGLPVEH